MEILLIGAGVVLVLILAIITLADDKVISDLNIKLESAGNKVTELETEIEDLNDEVQTKDARIDELEKVNSNQSDQIVDLNQKLEKAQRNDTPQDPETGKFVSKKKKKAATKK